MIGQGRRVTGRWQSRPVASSLLRLTVLLVPVSIAVAAGVVTARTIARATEANGLTRLAVALVASTVVLLACDRLARRLLPLAALLRLTLVFPDRAPARISVALRSRNVRSLRGWAREASGGGGGGDQSAGERATTVLALAAALNAHDRRTRGHSERVRVLSLLVAEELGLDDDDVARLGWAALLHDIGKLVVPATILNKPGAPDAREWEILSRHPADGARIAEPLQEWLGEWIGAIEEHHERYDGTGYPRQLAGKDIVLAARIVSIADSFETMTAVRSYSKPMSTAAARKELARCAGTHFDPRLVRAFYNISLGRLSWKVGIASWLAQLPIIGVVPRAGAAMGQAPVMASGYGYTAAGVVGIGAVLTLVGAPVPADSAVSPSTGPGKSDAPVSVETEPVASGNPLTAPPLPGSIATALLEAQALATPESGATLAPQGGNGNGDGDGNGDGNGSDGGPPAQAAQDSSGHPHGGPPGQADKDWSGHPLGGPPGQADKDWSGHPHGGPPGQALKDWTSHPLGGPPGQQGDDG